MSELTIDALPERVAAKITPDPVTGCWVWTACRCGDGYGRASYAGNVWMAHRLVYELLVGPIPAGLQLDHQCLNTSCVRPDPTGSDGHCEVVSFAENMRRRAALRVACKRGHPFDAANTYRRKRGGRDCRTCMRERFLRWRERRDAAAAGKPTDLRRAA